MNDFDEILNKIDYPSDLKELESKDLPEVCNALRSKIIDVCSQNPGHFGASLGVVELTVALHYVLNTPYDNLVWDVGHQAYGHKILTGRRDVFNTNRQYKGISGFPKMSESEYDAFGTGHSSTSISAALGLAVAAKNNGEDDKMTVAVIGDGAMTGGMAFEALNNAAADKANILIILNDNNMAIDPNVGGLNDYLLDITTSKSYNKIKNDVWDMLKPIPASRKLLRGINNSMKSFLLKQSNLFQALGIRYFGPIDGHDVEHLVEVLKDLSHIGGPKLLHIITKKGKGFKPAEDNQTVWHAPGKFNKETGERFIVNSSEPQPPKFQEVFGNTLLDLARKNEKIIGITPAMPSGSSLNIMMKEMPERTFDVGIAEQHAVTFSAGLAAGGMIPFCNIYSSFMQRAYDQVIHDVALQNLNVVFCLDRGGVVGDDGATHQGVFDLASFRCIPNITMAAPMNEEYLRNLMFTAQSSPKGTVMIRYPRGKGSMVNWETDYKELEIGKGRKLSSGKKLAVLSLGTVGVDVQKIIEKRGFEDVAHYDLVFLKPLDTEILHEVFKTYDSVITVEDGSLAGGFGSAVIEFMVDNSYCTKIKRLGVPDIFVEQGSQEQQKHDCGYDLQAIEDSIESFIN